ncbi:MULTISPECIES: hypothetical protein [unclassified Paracoccus (in: a-proteobacteria)]|uniref:hypothetical protein n=1 Tax=unclassified Paracoccus (in: a-proteobacteria) TaxID=2688777 RepID=UPI0012B38519|nr:MULTISPECIES: hypothetical protein [unclassified Paracoccus (in: a-proteobacteria)]UXU74627.1 hypothetical protein GB879_012135 [Paracoccus sp. SMMA_5]UXU80521.1 hypothetical protein GB880_012120 [Paracoccus sp. SMMA_5_TC]
MGKRTWGALACMLLVVAGCGRFGDSSLNPLRWMGSAQPASIEPKGGYPTERADGRLPLSRITAARWEPLYEGRLLVVEGLGASKGWWDARLQTETPMPAGRLSPDENGVLRLLLVGKPPQANTFEAANPPNPVTDRITVGLPVPNAVLDNLREVVITSAGNSVTLRR